MNESRRHPDLFTKGEAAVYLHFSDDPTNVAGHTAIDNLRERKLLIGIPMAKERLYHRRELDSLVDRMVVEVLGPSSRQKNPVVKSNNPMMRLAGAV